MESWYWLWQCWWLCMQTSIPRVNAVSDLIGNLSKPKGIALDTRSNRIYWAEVGVKKIRSASLDGSDIRDVVVEHHVKNAPIGVAVDPIEGKVYWTSRRKVRRATAWDGSDEEVVADSGYGYGGGIVLDRPSGHVYWTDWMHGNILVANMTRDSETEIFTKSGLTSPVDIAVYRSENETPMLYWSDVGRGKVERAALDGHQVQALNISWATMQTYGIAVDTEARKLYLTDYEHKGLHYTGRIVRTSLNGDDFEVLVSETGMSMPYSIELDPRSRYLYWTDQKLGKIQRLALRCPASTMEVASRTNTTVAVVMHGIGDHGASIEVSCPEGYNGSITLACYDGKFELTAGHCGRACPAGFFAHSIDQPTLHAGDDVTLSTKDSASLKIEHGQMSDKEMIQTECPRGLIGPASLVCQDGRVLIFSNECRKPKHCEAGQMLVGNALVKYSKLRHGLMDGGACGFGFEGYWVLQCQDGELVPQHNTSCRATCRAGKVWVDGGDIEVSHGSLEEGGNLKVVCPSGSSGPGVRLACQGGFINVVQDDCKRNLACPSTQMMIGHVKVSVPRLNEGEEVLVDCPDEFSGTLNVSCPANSNDQMPKIIAGTCVKGCASGWVLDSGRQPVQVRHPAIPHGKALLTPCPDGYRGKIPLFCNDGNVTLNCEMEDHVREKKCACIQSEKAQEFQVSSSTPFFALAAAGTAAIAMLGFAICFYRMRLQRLTASAAALGSPPGATKPPVAELSAGLPTVPSGTTSSGRTLLGKIGRSSPHSHGSSGSCWTCPPTEVIVDRTMAVPLYWATGTGVEIFPDPNRIQEVQELMTATWRACYTRDRKLVAGAERVPTGCRVANVLRVENHRAFQRYWNYKEDLSACREEKGCSPFPTLTSDRINFLDDKVNERYLFHGTNPEAAHAIARDVFHIEKAGSCAGSMFGRGIYLAENASKSDEYAKEGAGVYLGLCAMLVCRAVLGEVHTVSCSGDLEAYVRSGQYDSVCGDRLAAAGTFREMVFYDEEAVYAEFIVIYARVFENE
eukprot:TRINITY_DN1086_c0_g1_i1.p1 TRINITY_DN1086_c0_g1~~TRINITY_DN1086_c0_g1_i1.p1  ORF type:complete len:1023 (+),score=164.48 TRINITY_DN1086_c0_g1_i1:102-3170(+)